MQAEHVSTVLTRVLNNVPRNGELPDGIPVPEVFSHRPRTLPELVRVFELEESRDNPDLVTPLSSLRATKEGMVEVPRLGVFAFTDWSRRQCASLLGCRFDRWFENAAPQERADDLNRRFLRATGTVRLRTTQLREPVADVDSGVNGMLRAFVSPGYTPIADTRLARMLIAAVGTGEHELRLVRADFTDRTTSYVVAIGKPFRHGDANARVGQVWGGLLVRNSGVGFASLTMMLHLTRLACLNGMVAPLVDAEILRRRHRGIDDDALRFLLAEKLECLPERLALGSERLLVADSRPVLDVSAEITRILGAAGLPARHAAPILAAYHREPLPSAFGVSQAVTLAAQALRPEERLELERAAGTYLATLH